MAQIWSEDEELDVQLFEKIPSRKKHGQFRSDCPLKLPAKPKGSVASYSFCTKDRRVPEKYKGIYQKKITRLRSIYFDPLPEKTIDCLGVFFEETEQRVKNIQQPLLMDCSMTAPTQIIRGDHPELDLISITHTSFLIACEMGLGRQEYYRALKGDLIWYLESFHNLVVDTLNGEGPPPILFTPSSLPLFLRKEQNLETELAKHDRRNHTPRQTVLERELAKYRAYAALFRQKNEESPFQKEHSKFCRFQQKLFSAFGKTRDTSEPIDTYDSIGISQAATILKTFADNPSSPVTLITRTRSALERLEDIEFNPPSYLRLPSFIVTHKQYIPINAYAITVSLR